MLLDLPERPNLPNQAQARWSQWLLACIALCLHCGWNDRAQAQSFADVIEQAEQSVVRIEVSSDEGASLGSGFIIDNEGTMITNCHVLAGAHTATAYFPNGRSSPVLGTLIIDETRDIIVAKIRVKDTPALAIANSLPRKGEEVMALGAPKGLSFSATKGIVSAIRPAQEMRDDVGRFEVQGTWIQVDAPISPGNSGGPLINNKGEVVAMSTLASQGSAQNLNFGISSQDIANAIKYSSFGKLATLREAASRVRMSESGGSRPGGRPNPNGALAKKMMPPEALQDYVRNAQSSFKELMIGLRKESARLSVDLKEMRRGTPGLPPGAVQKGISIMRVTAPGRRDKKWYFLNQRVKDVAITEQQERIRRYTKLKNKIKSFEDADSIFELLWNFGPALEVREERSVGFATDLFVVHAFNAHDAIATYDDKPYLLYLNSTAGISGGEILSGPIFVAGTATAMAESGLTTALTVLQEVSKTELREAIGIFLAENASEVYRVWTAKNGNYSVKAKLLGSDGKKAVLQKEDGKILNVDISSLTNSDQELIRNSN
ncbi:MAG: S1C family serine protease [Pirellulaceae bacterium]